MIPRRWSRTAPLRILGLLLLIAGPAWRSAAGQAPPVPEATRAALLALEKEWDDAIVRKDMATLERILDPGFLFIDVDGSVTTRAALLAGIRSPKLVIEPFVTRDVRVRVYGRTAILTGWFETCRPVHSFDPNIQLGRKRNDHESYSRSFDECI